MLTLEEYIESARPFVKDFCLAHFAEYSKGMPTHPGVQKHINGKRIHTLQVITKALELNQGLDVQKIIEVCLVHDLRGCESLSLDEEQKMAIAATKGKALYEHWRPTPHYKFVVLILIADMWSAFINDNNL